jgi:hypothetical protein
VGTDLGRGGDGQLDSITSAVTNSGCATKGGEHGALPGRKPPGFSRSLHIEVPPPGCAAWNFRIGNFSMNALDYLHRRAHANKLAARYEDGRSV